MQKSGQAVEVDVVGGVLAARVVVEAEAVLEGAELIVEVELVGGRGSSGRGGARAGASDNGSDDPGTWEPSRPASYTPPTIPFTGAMPGPSGIAVGVTDPLACFHLFLPPELYDDILQQTNLYAAQREVQDLSHPSIRQNSWHSLASILPWELYHFRQFETTGQLTKSWHILSFIK